ncbi:hypothetical protein Vadar_023087 [Vaccinium darrowii]|uniref:Uncharacterized protein n=1 Tax=Vaccinium darrowii TaxID=229202 RepID=A0ACB7ZDA4_9ERIC|nr:hypothetical protein Vadar_023087 [Vaccinium darrowii]
MEVSTSSLDMLRESDIIPFHVSRLTYSPLICIAHYGGWKSGCRKSGSSLFCIFVVLRFPFFDVDLTVIVGAWVCLPSIHNFGSIESFFCPSAPATYVNLVYSSGSSDMGALPSENPSSTLMSVSQKDQGPTIKASAPDARPKKKICCACPDTKKLRDECIVEHGEAACSKWIEAHLKCLRAEGFNV